MRSRINGREDALRSLQASVSDEPHPLLNGDDNAAEAQRFLAATRNGGDSIPGPSLTREDEEFLDAFGVASRRLLSLDIKLTHTHTR